MQRKDREEGGNKESVAESLMIHQVIATLLLLKIDLEGDLLKSFSVDEYVINILNIRGVVAK